MTTESLHLTITCEAIFETGLFYTLVLDTLAAADDCTSITIDMRWVEHVHSPLLAELVRLYVHLQKKDIELRLSALNPMNRSLLTITRLDTLITITDAPSH